MGWLSQQLASWDTFFSGVTILVIGALVGFVSKELLLPTLFETWKNRRALSGIYQKYRDPLFLASCEFASRLLEIIKTYPTPFLSSKVRENDIKRLMANSADDPYFQRYKLISSVYRFCAFLGWLELYRQEIVFLDSGHLSRNKAMESSLANIRSDIADGHLNRADDWSSWDDHLVFREELRAIGEAMIFVDAANRQNVIGYRRFCEIYVGNSDPARKSWFDVAALFLLDLPKSTAQNFRLIRLRRTFLHLIDLLEALDHRKVPNYLREFQRELQPSA